VVKTVIDLTGPVPTIDASLVDFSPR